MGKVWFAHSGRPTRAIPAEALMSSRTKIPAAVCMMWRQEILKGTRAPRKIFRAQGPDQKVKASLGPCQLLLTHYSTLVNALWPDELTIAASGAARHDATRRRYSTRVGQRMTLNLTWQFWHPAHVFFAIHTMGSIWFKSLIFISHLIIKYQY